VTSSVALFEAACDKGTISVYDKIVI